MSPTVLGRILFVLGYLILFSIFSLEAMARELTVFAIEKNLQLSNKEPVYHDIYLDGGSEAGLRAGQIVTVARRIPLHDLTRNRPLGDMHLNIAQLKILYVQRGSSVARLYRPTKDSDRPVVEFNTVMVGDNVASIGVDDEETDGDTKGETKGSEPEKVKEAPAPKKEGAQKPADKLPEKTVEKAENTPPPPEPNKKDKENAPEKQVEPVSAPKT